MDAGGDLTAVGWLVFLSAVGGASAQVVGGSALGPLGPPRGVGGVALAVGAVNTAVYGQIDTFGALLALWVPYAFTQSVFQGLIVALAADVTPHGRLGQAMAIDSTAYSIGVALAALLAIAAGDAAPALSVLGGRGGRCRVPGGDQPPEGARRDSVVNNHQLVLGHLLHRVLGAFLAHAAVLQAAVGHQVGAPLAAPVDVDVA